MNNQWTRDDVLKVVEVMMEKNESLYCHSRVRRGLDRDHNLFYNQVIREATGNVAYRSVDFDINGISDEEFWNRIDATNHNDLIEENAATTILKMAERFQLIN